MIYLPDSFQAYLLLFIKKKYVLSLATNTRSFRHQAGWTVNYILLNKRQNIVGVVSEQSNNGDEVTVSVTGRFDYRIYDSFKASFDDIDETRKAVNIDLSETEYMDSSALGMLLMLREHVGRAVKICLVKPSPDVMRVLTIANFDKLFSIRS